MNKEIYELLDDIQKRPDAHFMREKKSLELLQVYLLGFDKGMCATGVSKGVYSQLRPFNEWVAKELGFSGSTRGWYNMVSMKAESDEKAFNLFFELLQKFKKKI